MQMPCHYCHVVKRLQIRVLHGTVGKGDVDRSQGGWALPRSNRYGKSSRTGIMGPTYIRRESSFAVLYVEYC